jgi:hypothetical protein
VCVKKFVLVGKCAVGCGLVKDCFCLTVTVL